MIKNFNMGESSIKEEQDAMHSKESSKDDPKFKYKAGAFLAGVTGLSLLSGFGMTLSMAKKKDPEMFTKGIHTLQKGPAVESGGSLALRALGRGTFYAVSGVSILFYGVWKLMAVNDMKEFRDKVGKALPPIPKSAEPEGRTEFSGVNDLLQYIIDEDQKKKTNR